MTDKTDPKTAKQSGVHTELRRQDASDLPKTSVPKSGPRPRAKVVPRDGDDTLDDLFNDMPV